MVNYNINDFGYNLFQIRTKKGISRDDLAFELDVDTRTIYAYENGEKLPRLPRLVKLCEFLEVGVEDILRKCA